MQRWKITKIASLCMKCKIIIGGLISIIMLTSCGDYLEKQAAKKELKKMLGSEIIFSGNMTPKSLGHTIPDPGYTGSKKPLKVVSYTMPLFCSICSLEVLEYWKTFMTSLNKEFGSDKIDFVFIFDYKSETELTEAIREFEFDYPVYYDRGYFVNANSHISKKRLFVSGDRFAG